jgi:hypothetical protein
MSSKSRDLVVDYVLNEVWGPTIPPIEGSFQLPPADSKELHHIPEEHWKSKIVDPDSGEHILQGAPPSRTYGTGVLHAPESWEDEDKEAPAGKSEVLDAGDEAEDDDVPPPADVDTVGGKNHEQGDESFSLEQSQKVHPNAMGMTFEPLLFDGDKIFVEFSGAVYDEIKLMFGDRGPIQAWKRKAISGTHELIWNSKDFALDTLHALPLEGNCEDYVSLKIRFRKSTFIASEGVALTATVVVKNKAQTSAEPDVFQSTLKLSISGDGFMRDAVKKPSPNSEQQELDHLYRHARNFATGHGTSASWSEVKGEPLRQISTIAIPQFYQEVLDFDALPSISMKMLSNASRDDVSQTLKGFIEGYKSWIETESVKSRASSGENSEIVDRLEAKAMHIYARICKGFSLVCEDSDTTVFNAFQMANDAMYQQQKNGKKPTRKWSREKNAPFSIEDEQEPTGYFGSWRPFQIAFLLAVIPGLVDPTEPSREEIDLIFFPTGGGKTEAYLGASAFTILHRRLTSNSSEHLGVDVLMRYTLRLLTIQQFERSAGLISVLELMRAANPGTLGEKPISIGVWLGADTTPNWRKDGYGLLKDIKDRKEDDPNPFILSRCPVCAAEFGWEAREPKGHWRGYAKLPATGAKATIRFVCPDRTCDYGDSDNPLPIWITDEDVYEEQPSFILGTVDKFAQMAWRAEAKQLFNLNSEGVRQGPPPALIIQDELHLISGPLGSMVGLYEPVIEALCTDDRLATPVKPKIVASTATTRNYESQIRGLYGRDSVMLFPQAIDRVNETYFSEIKINKETGEKERGSLYLGLNPATYGSAQTSAARIAAILKQAPNMVPDHADESMDYYRTSVWFFNSLKELGMTLTLMQSVTRDMIGGLKKARRLPDAAEKSSYPHKILELTSRIDSNKVSSALSRLGKPITDPMSYDTCLASSIMEVGVDVPRLGLLTIMAQPKTTSQYIQVSGRVGRDRRGPGLVVMLYNSKRSRDRSVYERFQSYHETVYAQVEPISVTPFSIEAMQHGLKGAIIAMYRMSVPDDATPEAMDWDKFDRAVDVLRTRISKLDVALQSQMDFEKQARNLKEYWAAYRPSTWGYSYQEQYVKHDPAAVPALMRGRREPLKPQVAGDKSIMVMTSMRSVDGQTKLEISSPYAFLEGDE